MKSFLKMNIMIAALAAIVMSGCNTNDVVNPGLTKPGAPSGTMVQSASATSVKLKWTAPTSTTDVTAYVMMAIEQAATGTPEKKEVIVSGASTTTGVIGGLTEGKVYAFMVHSINDTLRSDASNEVLWSPARRSTASFKLYSSTNATQGSGLGIFRTAGPAVLTVASGGEWDVCFDDKFNPADPRIGSPGQSAYVDNAYQFPNKQFSKVIYTGRTYTGITSLDDIYESDALNVMPTPVSENMYQIGSIGGTSNWGSVFVWKDASTTPATYWYAKLVMKRTAGKFIQGTGSSAYVEVDVSYQNTKNLPYAVKQRVENFLQIEQGRRDAQAK
ncbi:MAG: fibronectin type III domain-containing protein [Candidatus Kapabacteria bacterium]|nr:fibronectin type III domain-containing protein [Candidatus Kapabacteria bacterium]